MVAKSGKICSATGMINLVKLSGICCYFLENLIQFRFEFVREQRPAFISIIGHRTSNIIQSLRMKF